MTEVPEVDSFWARKVDGVLCKVVYVGYTGRFVDLENTRSGRVSSLAVASLHQRYLLVESVPETTSHKAQQVVE